MGDFGVEEPQPLPYFLFLVLVTIAELHFGPIENFNGQTLDYPSINQTNRQPIIES